MWTLSDPELFIRISVDWITYSSIATWMMWDSHDRHVEDESSCMCIPSLTNKCWFHSPDSSSSEASTRTGLWVLRYSMWSYDISCLEGCILDGQLEAILTPLSCYRSDNICYIYYMWFVTAFVHMLHLAAVSDGKLSVGRVLAWLKYLKPGS